MFVLGQLFFIHNNYAEYTCKPNPTMQDSPIPQCTFLLEKCLYVWRFPVQNIALWYICVMHCDISQMVVYTATGGPWPSCMLWFVCGNCTIFVFVMALSIVCKIRRCCNVNLFIKCLPVQSFAAKLILPSRDSREGGYCHSFALCYECREHVFGCISFARTSLK